MRLSGRARVAGVIGYPIAHSLSPRLHGHWLDSLEIDGAYLPLAIAPEHLDEAVRGLARAGFRGVNVTVPHKRAVMALCDEITEGARAIGAVNTLVFADGRIQGSNSDGYGFMANLRAAAPSWTPGAGPAVVLGAGGAARAVIRSLLDAGVPEIRLTNRTRETAERLAAVFRDSAAGTVTVDDWAGGGRALAGAALLVNATSLGMVGQPPLRIDLTGLAGDAVVADLVYNPLETPLLAAARANGNPAVDGLGMLLHQARPGFAAWFGVEPRVDETLRRAVLAGLEV